MSARRPCYFFDIRNNEEKLRTYAFPNMAMTAGTIWEVFVAVLDRLELDWAIGELTD